MRFIPVRPPPRLQGTLWYVAMVDDADYEWLSRWKWQAVMGWKRVSAKRTKRVKGTPVVMSMHREIVNAAAGELIDHANGNSLDNRRGNLRRASRSQNQQNKRPSPSVSGYKGVHLVLKHWTRKRWQARITWQKRKLSLGCYETPEAAARAYDVAAREYFGEFARTNFGEEGTNGNYGRHGKDGNNFGLTEGECSAKDDRTLQKN